MKIGVTGIEGLIGWHLNCHLKGIPDMQVVPANRETFSSSQKLETFARESDVIVHLAGMNRGDDQEVARTNIELAEKLISACRASQKKHHIIFASSTHIHRGTPYGVSKKKCAELFSDFSKESKGSFTCLILPHVFGEGGKPFYNSAVSTFCHQIANGETPKIDKDIELELVHCQQVAREIVDSIRSPQSRESTMIGKKISVSEVLKKIQSFSELYRKMTVPNLDDSFELDLFNTFRSYLYPKFYPFRLELKTDPRGSLFEAEKNYSGGQTFISTTKPGITRGNHYHHKKIERFCVIQGNAKIRIRKLFSTEVRDFAVSGSSPEFIDMPTLHTHNITNIGDTELLTLFWSNEIFDPKNPDTYPEPV